MTSTFTARFQNALPEATHTNQTDIFVQIANDHIDALYNQKPPKRIGDSFFHALAVFLSKLNVDQGTGGPFGAVIVKYEGGLDEKGHGIGKPIVVGIGANHVVPKNDPSAHAEMEAYRDAAERLGQSDLKNCVLFSSCECCPQCLGVAYGAGIGRVSYTNTRADAAAINFNDKTQYDILTLPREKLMTFVDDLPGNRRAEFAQKLGMHGAMVLDPNGNVYAMGDAHTNEDPTSLPSINAVRNAVARYAADQRVAGNEGAIFSLPEGFTLVCREIPHAGGLITADWARMLRHQVEPDNPGKDDFNPIPSRVIYLNPQHEEIAVSNDERRVRIPQPSQITYREVSKPDSEREIPTDHYREPCHISPGAQSVFDRWAELTGQGRAARY